MAVFRRVPLLVVLAVILAACSTVSERRLEYKKATSLPTLEMPPDLLSVEAQDELVAATAPMGEAATLSEYTRAQGGAPAAARPAEPGVVVGPQLKDEVRIARDGAVRWLVLPGEPGTWWPRLKEFWVSEGFEIARDDPRIGIMETTWSENRGSVPVSSLIKKAFSFLYSSSTRDMYIVRVEPGHDPGTTAVYLSHRGMQQVSRDEGVQWLPRPSEAWLEDQMLKRLALFVGADESQAEQIALEAAAVEELAIVEHGEAGEVWLRVKSDYPRAWARVASAIPRTDITIEDYDRTKGLFYVAGVLPPEEEKDPSWLKRFMKGYVEEDPVEFKIKLEDEGETTRVFVQDKEGAPNYSKRAQRLLEKLSQEMR